MAEKFDVEQYEKEAQGLAMLGHLAWWTVREVAIDKNTLEDLYVQNDIHGYFPVHQSDKKCFIDAVKDYQIGRKNIMVRKLSDTENETTFTIVEENIDKLNATATYKQQCNVSWDKTHGNITFTDNYHPCVPFITERYNHYKDNYTSDEIRGAIQEAIESMQSINIRERGGVKFVPIAFKDKLFRLRHVVEGINNGSRIGLSPQLDITVLRQDMFREFMEQAQIEVNQANKELDQIAENISDGSTKVRSNTVQNRFKSFKEMKGKAALYADLFRGNADSVQDQIKLLENRAMDLLSKL